MFRLSRPRRRGRMGQTQTLDGGDVLPGFTVPVADLFADVDRLTSKQEPDHE
jgi:hypothetical protein